MKDGYYWWWRSWTGWTLSSWLCIHCLSLPPWATELSVALAVCWFQVTLPTSSPLPPLKASWKPHLECTKSRFSMLFQLFFLHCPFQSPVCNFSRRPITHFLEELTFSLIKYQTLNNLWFAEARTWLIYTLKAHPGLKKSSASKVMSRFL